MIVEKDSNRKSKRTRRKPETLALVPLRQCVALRRNPQYLTPHQMDAMKRSIERDGFLVPILVRPMKGKSKSNGTAQQYEIVSGNHRAMAAKEVGMTHVPAVIGRLNERQSRRVAVNLNTIHGEPNAELMAPFLAELDDALLATIHLDDSMRRQVLAFDETLASRLAQLQPPDSLNNPSTGNIPDCLCPTCGRRHQTKTKDEKSAKA